MPDSGSFCPASGHPACATDGQYPCECRLVFGWMPRVEVVEAVKRHDAAIRIDGGLGDHGVCLVCEVLGG